MKGAKGRQEFLDRAVGSARPGDRHLSTWRVPEPRAFSESDLQFLEIFTRDVAVALNTLELLVAEKASTAARPASRPFIRAVALPVDEILNEAVNVMERYIGPRTGSGRTIAAGFSAMPEISSKSSRRWARGWLPPRHILNHRKWHGHRWRGGGCCCVDEDNSVRSTGARFAGTVRMRGGGPAPKRLPGHVHGPQQRLRRDYRADIHLPDFVRIRVPCSS